jgi:hypothetical protein
VTRFLPTRSRSREGTDLLTYGGKNGRWRASNGGVVQLVYLVMVRVASGEALVPVMAPAAVTGGPPPSNNSAREVLVWRVNGVSSSGNGGWG